MAYGDNEWAREERDVTTNDTPSPTVITSTTNSVNKSTNTTHSHLLYNAHIFYEPDTLIFIFDTLPLFTQEHVLMPKCSFHTEETIQTISILLHHNAFEVPPLHNATFFISNNKTWSPGLPKHTYNFQLIDNFLIHKCVLIYFPSYLVDLFLLLQCRTRVFSSTVRLFV